MHPRLLLRLFVCPMALLMVLLLAVDPAHSAPRKKGKRGSASEASGKKSFSELIKDHEMLEGVLTLYRSPEHLYATIPDELLGEPLGLSGVRVKALGDWSIRGAGLETRVVTFKKTGEQILLLKKNLDFVAKPDSPFRLAVDKTFPDSPVFMTPIIRTSDDHPGTLVDLSSLFSPDLMQLLPNGVGYEAKREDSSVEEVRVHPDNLMVRVTYRFRRSRQSSQGPHPAGTGQSFRQYAISRLADPRFVESTIDYNLYQLPDEGFRPRRADQRIGGFEESFKDYTGVSQRDSAFRHRLLRWRVEKEDPRAALSPAKQPIIFYIGKATPPEWRPRIREAALWWNRSFEKIGIRGVIQVLDQPEDPEWEASDLRHSMIYWNLSDNLMFSGLAGPMITDPRTGEVLKANVYLNGEFPSFALNRYLVYAWWRAPGQTGEMDPFQLPASGSSGLADHAWQLGREQSGLPFRCDHWASFSSQIAFARLVLQARGVMVPGTGEADRFAREAFAELVAHEVGHALGFSHNFKASLVSSAEDLNSGRASGDPDDHPFTASIMDYTPIYLAPPGIPQGDYFMHGVGSYDDLLVEYIYRLLEDTSPEEENEALSAIARRAELTPGLMFDDGPLSAMDPSSNTDDLGDDPLGFAEQRLKMIQEEVLPRLAELVTAEGHDYNILRQALDATIFSVAMDYIDITARHVGGQETLRLVARGSSHPEPPPVSPVDPELQRRALSLLDRLVFDPSAFPASPELLSLLKPDLFLDWNYPYRYATDYSFESRVTYLYDSALATLLDPRRLARVLDNQHRYQGEGTPLTLPELFRHLQTTALSGLESAGRSPATDQAPAISHRRRSLQRRLVSRLGEMVLNPPEKILPEAVQVARASLADIRSQIRKITGAPQRLKALDGYSSAHLNDLDAAISRALDAKEMLGD